jgi:hypothetical protein
MIGRFYSGLKLALPCSQSGDEYQWGGVIYGRGAKKKRPFRKEEQAHQNKTKNQL